MTKSKSKPRGQAKAPAQRKFIAVHQDRLMQACARGLFASDEGALTAESTVTAAAIEREKKVADWGHVFLLEVVGDESGGGRSPMTEPLLLSDIVACWAQSSDAAMDVEARLETFEDTVPAAIEIKVDAALFVPADVGQGEQPSLALIPDSAPADNGNEAPLADVMAGDHGTIEKLAGAIAAIGWLVRSNSASLGKASELLRFLDSANTQAGTSAIQQFARSAHRIFRPDQSGVADEWIYENAAQLLCNASPKDGIDPVSFVAKLLDMAASDGHARADVETFIETLRKVLDNRIELRDSKLDDAGLLGQRALMVFLLAPRIEDLERWTRVRPVGKGVKMLATVLSGLYSGLGGLPRDVKGPTRSAFFAAINAARDGLKGLPLNVSTNQQWNLLGEFVEVLRLSGFELIARTTPPREELSRLITGLRQEGLFAGVDRDTGTVAVAMRDGSLCAEARYETGMQRLPAREVVRLAARAKPKGRSQFAKEALAAILQASMRPVVPCLDVGTGELILEVEVESASEVAEGLAAIKAAVERLDVTPVSRPPAEPPKGASGKKRPRKSSKSSSPNPEGPVPGNETVAKDDEPDAKPD